MMTTSVRSPSAPVVVGITGGIAAGKSAVLAALADLGADVVDADAVYRDLVAPGQPLLARLRDHFGTGVVASDGSLDRRALGAIVFADPDKLAELDALTHPTVRAEVNRRVAASTAEVVAIEAIKLVESGQAEVCDEVWLVVADPAIQRARLIARNGVTPDEADRRLAAQAPADALRRSAAHHLIDNSGDPAALRAEVERRWSALRSRRSSTARASILPK